MRVLLHIWEMDGVAALGSDERGNELVPLPGKKGGDE